MPTEELARLVCEAVNAMQGEPVAVTEAIAVLEAIDRVTEGYGLGNIVHEGDLYNEADRLLIEWGQKHARRPWLQRYPKPGKDKTDG